MTARRKAAIRKIKTRYRKLLRSRGVPEFVIKELTTISLLRAFAQAIV